MYFDTELFLLILFSSTSKDSFHQPVRQLTRFHFLGSAALPLVNFMRDLTAISATWALIKGLACVPDYHHAEVGSKATLLPSLYLLQVGLP